MLEKQNSTALSVLQSQPFAYSSSVFSKIAIFFCLCRNETFIIIFFSSVNKELKSCNCMKAYQTSSKILSQSKQENCDQKQGNSLTNF